MEKLSLEQVTIKALNAYSFNKLMKLLLTLSATIGLIADVGFFTSYFSGDTGDNNFIEIILGLFFIGVLITCISLLILITLNSFGFLKSLRNRYENQLNYEEKRRVIIDYISDCYLRIAKSNIEFSSQQMKEAEKSIDRNSEISQHYNGLLIEVL